MVELSVVGCSCRHSQRDVEEAVGLFWIAVRLVEPLCARACASASALTYLDRSDRVFSRTKRLLPNMFSSRAPRHYRFTATRV